MVNIMSACQALPSTTIRHGRLDTNGAPKHGILLFYQDTVNKPLVDYWEINRVYYRLLTVILDRHYWSANLRAGSPNFCLK